MGSSPPPGGATTAPIGTKWIGQSTEFYRRLFGFATLLESERLIVLDVAGKGVLLHFPEGGTKGLIAVPGGGEVIPPHGGSRAGSGGVAVESVVTAIADGGE